MFFQLIRKIREKLFFSARSVEKNAEITPGFLKILDCFVRNKDKWLSGADVMRDVKLPSGTVYPLVIRMVAGGWLQRLELAGGRRVFKLTDCAMAQANDVLAKNSHIWQSSLGKTTS